MVTCEKFTGANLVISDCDNAGKDAAASRIESMDRVSMERSWLKESETDEALGKKS
jgi:hypothetical protein